VTPGPGDPDCKLCGGSGVLRADPTDHLHLQRGSHPPSFRRCRCVLRRDIAANVERGMPGLMDATRIPESPLTDYLESDLWITASRAWFMAHLRHVAIRQPPIWYFKVVTDADLMTAWLASAALKGKEILDPDAARVSLSYVTLPDLVVPPELLILRLGVKRARNVASPEVLLEALGLRDHLNVPTWVWDNPQERLAEGHICWSRGVTEYLATWPHLGTRSVDTPAPKTPPPVAQGVEESIDVDGDLNLGPPGRHTLSSGSGAKTLRKNGGDE